MNTKKFTKPCLPVHMGPRMNLLSKKISQKSLDTVPLRSLWNIDINIDIFSFFKAVAKFYSSFITDLVIQEGAVRHSGRQDANSVRPDEPGGDGGRLPSPVLCHKSLLP